MQTWVSIRQVATPRKSAFSAKPLTILLSLVLTSPCQIRESCCECPPYISGHRISNGFGRSFAARFSARWRTRHPLKHLSDPSEPSPRRSCSAYWHPSPSHPIRPYLPSACRTPPDQSPPRSARLMAIRRNACGVHHDRGPSGRDRRGQGVTAGAVATSMGSVVRQCFTQLSGRLTLL